MKVLSFDPGGTTSGKNKAAANGWCYMTDVNCKVYGTGALYSTGDLHKFLGAWDIKALPVDVVVIESYVILPNQRGIAANVGKRMITSESIGSISMWASMNGVEVVLQPASLKPAQAKLSGMNPKGKAKRFTHGMDAFNHGWYYMYTKGLVKTALEIEMGI